MDEASSQGNTVPLRQDGFQIVPPLLLIPSCGGHRADLGEKREPRETVYENCRKTNEQWRRNLTRHHRDREDFSIRDKGLAGGAAGFPVPRSAKLVTPNSDRPRPNRELQ